MKNASALTEKNKALTLNIAFNYGGRAEIVTPSPNSSPTRSRPTRSTKRRCALVCITRNCPTRTWSFALRGSTGSRISCSGRWRTPNWSSPTCCGRTFAARTSSRPWRSTSNASDASGVSTNDHDQDDGRRRVLIYAFLWRSTPAVTPCCSRRSSFRRCSRSWSPSVLACSASWHRTAQTALRRRVRRDRAVKEIRDDAVVLRTYKSGESDRVVVLWTRNYGKVRVLAKGIRKTTSRLGGNLETLAHVNVTS